MKRTVLTAFTLALTASAAQFAYVFEVFEDNSCRSYVVEFYPNGTPKCRGDWTTFSYWCDPAAGGSCVARTVPAPSIPVCGATVPLASDTDAVTLEP